MPLTLHVKLAESPTLAVSTDDLYGITMLAFGGSKAKDDFKKFYIIFIIGFVIHRSLEEIKVSKRTQHTNKRSSAHFHKEFQ